MQSLQTFVFILNGANGSWFVSQSEVSTPLSQSLWLGIGFMTSHLNSGRHYKCQKLQWPSVALGVYGVICKCLKFIFPLHFSHICFLKEKPSWPTHCYKHRCSPWLRYCACEELLNEKLQELLRWTQTSVDCWAAFCKGDSLGRIWANENMVLIWECDGLCATGQSERRKTTAEKKQRIERKELLS
jgi:hypothetical protein